MKILVISDIHGDVENILRFLDRVKELEFEVVVCPGDLTDPFSLPKGFTQLEIAKLILEELKSLGKPLLVVPGNNDTPEILNWLEKEKVSLHGKGKKIGEVGFYGCGGAKTPFNTSFELDEVEMRTWLEKGWEEVKECELKVQVTHSPPFNTRVDRIFSGGHVGSKVIREFILEKKPQVAISAHIHEAKGVDRLNGTLLMNSGKFPEGNVGWIEISKDKVDGKIINLI